MTCSVCRHEQRSQIDAALIRSDSLRNIAKQFGTSAAALHRHRNACVRDQLSKAKEISDVTAASVLVKELRELTRKTGEVLARAVHQKNGDLALKAIARLERQLELKGRLIGPLEERNNGGATVVQVVYVDASTRKSPQSFGSAKSNGLKTLIEGTCEPLLGDQNRSSAKTESSENVSDAPQRAGAAEGI
jgi:hypothetical protein